MEFTETGTLIEWDAYNETIIPMLHTNNLGKVRGGAFLCLPNFEELPSPFTIKHGEYRHTPCNLTSPHLKKFGNQDPSGWGEIATETMWKELSTDESKLLTVSVTLRTLSEEALLRPGFHPYFSVSGPFTITIGDTQIDETSILHDTPQAVPIVDDVHPAAILYTGGNEIRITSRIHNWPHEETPTYSYCVWTDSKNEYVCIEPVIGALPVETGLPSAFVLPCDKEVTLTFTIEVRKVSTKN